MKCITYAIYNVEGTDSRGRQLLSEPLTRRICYEEDTPYPPPESVCQRNYALQTYYANIVEGYGFAICARRHR